MKFIRISPAQVLDYDATYDRELSPEEQQTAADPRLAGGVLKRVKVPATTAATPRRWRSPMSSSRWRWNSWRGRCALPEFLWPE